MNDEQEPNYAAIVIKGWRRLGWTQLRMHKETGIARDVLWRFFQSEYIGMADLYKIASAVSNALMTLDFYERNGTVH